MPIDYDLKEICKQEAERRLSLLGNLADFTDYNFRAFNYRARQVYVSRNMLIKWWHAYQENGLDGLHPQWAELPEGDYALVQERYKNLDGLADAEMINKEDIVKHSEKIDWSLRSTERWLKRYRDGGLWALAPRRGSKKSTRRESLPRDLGTLSESDLEIVYERKKKLGDLANKKRITAKELQLQADNAGMSPRTLRYYWRAYLDYGLAGLAPKIRSDKGKTHDISARMRDIVRGIRLSRPDASVRAVHEEACKRARALNELEPSEFQVRNICNNIPESVKLIADGREGEFRNKYRITYRIKFENVAYQIDHTRVDVLVRDVRPPKYRTTSGEIRPWLTLCMDSQSRLVVGAKFGYDQPDRHVVAATIRDSLLISHDRPYGGLPDEIWIDNGKDFVSNHVHQLTRELGIKLQRCLPHQPQHKGIVERFFQTLNTRLWAKLPGYVNSNVVARNPKTKAELTLTELIAEFWHFIEQYHREVHSQTGKTPLEYWLENCYAEPVDPRLLDILLKEPKSRWVLKEGIKYENRVFWDSSLKHVVGQNVLIRAEPPYMDSTEIEVFYDGKWLCTAYATDSVKGRSINRSQIAADQRDQRENIEQQIQEAKDALGDADRQVEEKADENITQKGGGETDSSKKLSSKDKTRSVKQNSVKSKKRKKPDLLDRLTTDPDENQPSEQES